MSRRYRAAALWRGSAVVDAAPATLAIETTTHCNLSCAGCLRRWDTQPPRQMDAEVFDAALAWPGVETILLYGLGEPLLDPAIFDRVIRAREGGRFVQVSTNATLLGDEARRRLLEARPDAVIVSLDAADPRTYRDVRGDFDFETVVANVTAFAQAAAGGPTRCVVQMVLLADDRAARRAFQDRFGSLPGVTLRFKADETRPRRTATEVARPRRICPILFAGPLTIRVDGAVLPCCHMLEEEPLGNVLADDLDALWNGPRLRELRTLHGAGRINEIAPCRRCSLPLPPRWAATAALLTPPRLFRRVLPLAERLLTLR